MSQDQNAILQLRLDQNYQDYLAQLREKPFEEIIRLAPEITAAQQLCDELAAVCDDDEVEYLLGLDNPLEVVRGYWEQEISGYDHGEEMGHMLWRVREDIGDHAEQQEKKPFTKDEITVDPVMDFSGKEIVAYIEIWFDVGKRFQVYPDIDDSCDLYAKYDPVARTLQGELCIKDCDGGERWEPVELLPSEQEMIVGLMEEICRKDMGKSLRDTWADHHPAINRKNQNQKKDRRHQHER